MHMGIISSADSDNRRPFGYDTETNVTTTTMMIGDEQHDDDDDAGGPEGMKTAALPFVAFICSILVEASDLSFVTMSNSETRTSGGTMTSERAQKKRKEKKATLRSMTTQSSLSPNQCSNWSC